MRLTLVRHTQVQEKYQGCYNGHNEIGLSNEGVNQAKKLCKKLDLLKFDAIFCSDTFRAKETIKHYKYKENIEYTKVLREKSWGRHEGMSFDEIGEKEGISGTRAKQIILRALEKIRAAETGERAAQMQLTPRIVG